MYKPNLTQSQMDLALASTVVSAKLVRSGHGQPSGKIEIKARGAYALGAEYVPMLVSEINPIVAAVAAYVSAKFGPGCCAAPVTLIPIDCSHVVHFVIVKP